MKKLLLAPVFILLIFAATGCSDRPNETGDPAVSKDSPAKPAVASQKSSSEYPMSSAANVADKLEVYYFHSTARCYSCKTIGQYVRETMEQKYGEQIKSGKIDFRELNVDLPENRVLAKKYQAAGSSLFINRIKDGRDNIEPDMNVWKLLGDEVEFKSYLETKINTYLGLGSLD